ncbi:unnamed protein product [Rotaria magnacalcarata]|uniref:Uncharacterized protein n=1 Tax=Rotaria magnacalcarata TaxID=392030 RepID=A0A816RFF6_9BILA|nr:unnamed protein product [Rotaria magnacalcarata]
MSASLDDLFVYFKIPWVDGVVPIKMWSFHNVDHRTNNTSEAYNLRFATRLSRKHPNIWSFTQLIQSEHARFEHILIQLDAGASAPEPSTKAKAFQLRLDTLYNRFHEKEINAKELLSSLSLLIGKKKIITFYYIFYSLSSFFFLLLIKTVLIMDQGYEFVVPTFFFSSFHLHLVLINYLHF